MIRWGILGAGKIAYRFAASLLNEENSELYAIAVRTEEKALAFKEKFSYEKYYLDYKALIEDENVDAIYLSLPHGLHAEWAIQALKNHKAVLCEKPAVVNAEEMIEISKVAKENNTLFMEAMKPRFLPMYEKVKEIINNGTIGKLVSINTEICFPIVDKENLETISGKTYHTQKGQGGCLLDSGTYCASWLIDYLKNPIQITKTTAEVINDVDIYVESFMTDGNIDARLEVAFDRYKERDAYITGTDGSIHVYNLHRPNKIDIEKNNQIETIEIPYEFDDFYGEIAHFVELLKQGKTESDVMSLKDSIECAKLLDAIRESF